MSSYKSALLHALLHYKVASAKHASGVLTQQVLEGMTPVVPHECSPSLKPAPAEDVVAALQHSPYSSET